MMSHEFAHEITHNLPADLPVLRACEELIRSGNPIGAVTELKNAIKAGAGDWRLHNALGDALIAAGRGEEAIGAFIAAMQVKPDLAIACVKIGRIFFSRGMVPPALHWLRQAMQIDASCQGGMYSLAVAEAKGGCRERVAQLLEAWIAADPGDPVRRHLATAILGGSTPARPADGYVSKLFDSYAPHYDQSLAELRNSGPQLVEDALVALGFQPRGAWNVIDAGCGTGLVGERVKKFARRMIGVDLSPNMLQQAESRAIYDELACDDMTEFIRSRSEPFDLIIAADALTYLGELGAFFAVCADRLANGGLLIFTLEALIDGVAGVGYHLNPSGRYVHREDYACDILRTNGLTVRYRSDEPMRYEVSRPVPTLLFVAEKPLAS